jgi:hypothetical protein
MQPLKVSRQQTLDKIKSMSNIFSLIALYALFWGVSLSESLVLHFLLIGHPESVTMPSGKGDYGGLFLAINIYVRIS